MDTRNLKQRGLSWYARLRVPPSLQEAMGRTELVRALGTRDLKEANRLKHAKLAEMHEELTRAQVQATLPPESAEYVLATAKDYAAAVKRGELSQDEAREHFYRNLDEHLDLQGRTVGVDPDTGDPTLTDVQGRTLKLAVRVATAADTALLSQSILDYLAEKAPHINKQTAREKERQLNELAAWVGDCEVSTVTKRLAGKYVGDKLLKKGHAPKTVKDTLSNLSAFWRWLEGRGLVEFNVWQGMSSTVRGSTRGVKPERRPWTNSEIVTLLQGLPTTDPLWTLAAIAVYTGMRREEICRLRVAACSTEKLVITEGKTMAALREVPVHPALRPLIARLLKHSTDEYLIPGLLSGGDDDKRGHNVGKRFSPTLRTTLGLPAKGIVFHAFRHSFTQRCEEAGVPESTAKLLDGHARASITYGRYSTGVSFKTLDDAVGRITYGPVDALVKKLGKQVHITQRSTRRRSTKRDLKRAA